jgi:DNA polymerase III alpha subunit
MERYRKQLMTRMQTKGIAPQFAEQFFDEIRGFGDYGVSESHAARFRLIAYVTAWLKRRYHVRQSQLRFFRRFRFASGGVLFMTLEDETGIVNAVVWESVLQRYFCPSKNIVLSRYYRHSPG